jgi:von Willebrand factor type A domain
MSNRLYMIRSVFLTSVAGAALFAAAPASADTLTPTTFSGTVGVGGLIDITDKVGTISAGGPTTARADVLFVMDTTGSMSSEIGTVETAFAGTVSALSALGTVATGAAQFKDRTNDGYDAFDYQLTQDITTNSALTQSALSSYFASGGGDTPEQGLYALDQAATTTTWESGAKKIVVIVGDAPAHDDAHPTGAGGVSVTSVADALKSNGVTMIALDAGNLNGYGQFSGSGSLLDDGVAGSYTPPPFSSDPTALTSQIVSLIGDSFATYSTVSLGLVGGAPSDCSVSLPSSISGSFSRSSSESFSFGDVGVTGTHAGTCSFTVGLFADGALLATESDSITVTGGSVTAPEPSTWATMMIGFAALGYMGYRRKAKVTISSLA